VIRFVYGERWAPAAQALSWLAILAAFRIVFELAYDYLVVVKRSGSLLVVQVVWLVALVPALVIGARVGGLGAVGAAQLLVVAAVVTPIYVWRLWRSGVRPAALATQVWLPVVVGAAVFIASRALSTVVPSAFLAAAISGVIALIAIALLLYRDRAIVRSLRNIGAEAAPSRGPGEASRDVVVRSAASARQRPPQAAHRASSRGGNG
jgi:PST family polysaccharide transporter